MKTKQQKSNDSLPFFLLQQKWRKAKQDRQSRSEDVQTRLVVDGKDVFRKFNIKKVILFGSVLENKMSLQSDIDILVDHLPADQFYSFQCRLEDTLNLTVDLHTMDEDEKFIKKILKRGKVIYEV